VICPRTLSRFSATLINSDSSEFCPFRNLLVMRSADDYLLANHPEMPQNEQI
jgi:hypothetical protein